MSSNSSSGVAGASVFGPYVLCGWKVSSEIDLPELLPWVGGDGVADIEVVASPCEPLIRGPHFSHTDDGMVTLQLGFHGRLRISPEADRIEVQVTDSAAPLLVRAHLYGSVLAILCFRRGLLPVHGSAVRMGEGAVLFSGLSGAGKSTTATALALRGHALLCDDVCAVDLSNPRQPMLRAAFPRAKLLPDTIEEFGLNADTVYTEAAAGPKGHFGMVSLGGQATEPLPILGVYALEKPAGDVVAANEMTGRAGFLFLMTQVHRAFMGRALGFGDAIFRQGSVVAASVPMYRLERPDDLRRLDEVVRLIEERHAAPVGAGTQ